MHAHLTDSVLTHRLTPYAFKSLGHPLRPALRRSRNPNWIRRLRATEESAAASIEDAESTQKPDLVDPEPVKTKSAFKTCGEAIRAGVELFKQERYTDALDILNDALELPGRAKEFSGPSQSEEHAILYNMICCYSRLQEFDSAFTMLQELLESDFEDYATLRADSDLKELQKDPRFEEILRKSDSVPEKVMKLFRKKPAVNKPWLI